MANIFEKKERRRKWQNNSVIQLFKEDAWINRYSTFPALTEEVWDNVFRKQVITRLDSIMYGVLAAYVFYFKPGFWEKYKKMFFIVGVVLLGSFKYVMPLLENKVSLFQAVFSFSFQLVFHLLFHLLVHLLLCCLHLYQT